MAKKKKIEKVLKLQIKGGQANPAPPVGPALGAAGLNIMGFCKEFNDRTKDKMGEVLPVEITVYADKSFTFVTKEPPVANLIFTTRRELKVVPHLVNCPGKVWHTIDQGAIKVKENGF